MDQLAGDVLAETLSGDEGACGGYTFVNENKPATAFLFKLISQLQFSGTVPMIDVEAYGQWLTK